MRNLLIFLLLIGSNRINAQDTMELTDKIITKKQVFHCSLDTAWWKWTTHEGLLTFFGADNSIDLRPGGVFEIYFSKDAPKGMKGSEGCTVLSYLPQRLFSFTWNAPPSIMDARNSGYHTWVVVEFKKVSEHETEILLNHYGWPEGELWNSVYDYFDKAWGRVFESFGKGCEG